MPIRHTIRGRPQLRGATARRIAAARRALQRERDRYPLFSQELLLAQETPTARIARFDAELIATDQRHRDLAARQWRWARAVLSAQTPAVRQDILNQWNRSSIPPHAAYFADFVRRKLRALDSAIE